MRTMSSFYIFLVIIAFGFGIIQEEFTNESDSIGFAATCPHDRRVTYTAAVLEFEPDHSGLDVHGHVTRVSTNARAFIQAATDAKKLGADILVTPEYGLQSLLAKDDQKRIYDELTFVVPTPEEQVTPCLQEKTSDNWVIKQLSCAARDLKMYLVVNVAEKDSGLYYNTNVVFDRTGKVVARYRKQNLYFETWFTPGPKNNTQAVFTTDFGVKFSLQICFDITSENPGLSNVLHEGITDVAMSTAWGDLLPFFEAINYHNGWSRSVGANLLVSGHHWPERAKLGSGIYPGYSGLEAVTAYDPQGGSQMLVNTVHSCRTVPTTFNPEPLIKEPVIAQLKPENRTRTHLFIPGPMTNYTGSVLTQPAGQLSVCTYDGLCCHLSYQGYTSNVTYQLLAFSNLIHTNQTELFMQICTLASCIDEDVSSCGGADEDTNPHDTLGSFTLEGNFTLRGFEFPAVITRNFSLVHNDQCAFTEDGPVKTLTAQPGIENLHSASIIGRIFSKDEPSVEP